MGGVGKAVGSIFEGITSIFTGGKQPEMPEVPEVKEPRLREKPVKRTSASRTNTRKKGQAATILTGAQGLMGKPMLGKKTLLGQFKPRKEDEEELI